MIEEELNTSSGVFDVHETGASGLTTRPAAGTGDLCTEVAVRFPKEHARAPDPHNQTLRATRVRKITESASAEVAAAVVPESTKLLSTNKSAIRQWVIQNKSVAKLPTTMPAGPKEQVARITTCTLELARLVSGLPYPISFLTSIPGDTLRSFRHSTNSESQLAVIQLHTTHADAKLRGLCTG